MAWTVHTFRSKSGVKAALRDSSLRLLTGSKELKILMVLTSHDQLGNTGRTTGFWLEEFAAPYFVFRDAGLELTLAAPKGGEPPIDPKSDLPENHGRGAPLVTFYTSGHLLTDVRATTRA